MWRIHFQDRFSHYYLHVYVEKNINCSILWCFFVHVHLHYAVPSRWGKILQLVPSIIFTSYANRFYTYIYIPSTISIWRTISHDKKTNPEVSRYSRNGAINEQIFTATKGLAKTLQMETGLAESQPSPPSTRRSLNTSLVTLPVRRDPENPPYPHPRRGRRRPKQDPSPSPSPTTRKTYNLPVYPSQTPPPERPPAEACARPPFVTAPLLRPN